MIVSPMQSTRQGSSKSWSRFAVKRGGAFSLYTIPLWLSLVTIIAVTMLQQPSSASAGVSAKDSPVSSDR